MDNLMNPFEFAAKMRKGAQAMIAAQEDADMVRAVIAMAHGLDIRVVAEGVEV
jgi:EAL domain-containing protein (putative c-di-GMP-specific phosphodiesterase class I)